MKTAMRVIGMGIVGSEDPVNKFRSAPLHPVPTAPETRNGPDAISSYTECPGGDGATAGEAVRSVDTQKITGRVTGDRPPFYWAWDGCVCLDDAQFRQFHPPNPPTDVPVY